MTTETVVPDAEAQERAIRAAADKLIADTAAKHGLEIKDLPDYVRTEAYGNARQAIEAEARKQSNEYYHLYEQAKLDNAALQAQLGAIRENRTAATDARVVPTMEQIRDGMGRAQWYQLSEGQKLTALGIDPTTVDKAQLKALFGKGTDTALAVDMMKTQPYRYRQLRQAALALNLTGK